MLASYCKTYLSRQIPYITENNRVWQAETSCTLSVTISRQNNSEKISDCNQSFKRIQDSLIPDFCWEHVLCLSCIQVRVTKSTMKITRWHTVLIQPELNSSRQNITLNFVLDSTTNSHLAFHLCQHESAFRIAGHLSLISSINITNFDFSFFPSRRRRGLLLYYISYSRLTSR